jgi:hypothetical protein
MKRLGILCGVLFLFALAGQVFAQGMFADVPRDHWAYDAVSFLQEKEYLKGYPDRTFQGKRALTRYEFAMAISMIWQEMAKVQSVAGPAGPVGPPGSPGPAGPQGPAGLTPEELQKFQRLADEFSNELKALGTDVDQLKKDLRALTDRVTAVEKEQERIKTTVRGDVMVRGTAVKPKEAAASFDIDGRSMAKTLSNQFLNNLSVLWDYDLTLKGKVSDNTKATLVLNASNYVSALGNLAAVSAKATTAPATVTPWYFYIEHPVNVYFLGETNLTLGQFPFQLTPYTFKMIDTDYYNNLPKTDSGDFPAMGIKATKSWGPLDVTAFALNTKSIAFVANPVAQTAGARAIWNTPVGGKLGLTYMAVATGGPRANIYGADYNGKYMAERLGVYAEYTTSDRKAKVGGVDLSKDNTALDAAVNYNVTGGLSVGAGYRDIKPNFATAGYWHRIGVIKNPTNIKGGRGMIGYKVSDALDVNASYEDLQESKKTAAKVKIQRITAGVNYKLAGSDSVGVGLETIKLKAGGVTTGDVNYIDFGYGHSLGDNLSLRFYYQYIDFKGKVAGVPTFKGNVAGTQLTVKF